MKRILTSLILMILLATTAHAKPERNGDGQGRPEGADRVGRMQQNLGLSDEQVRQIREIRENNGSREEIRAVLTEEQRGLMKEHRKHRQGSGGQGRSAPPAEEGQPSDGKS
jgi:Spy/CpxP family protein refolding chaperone